MWGLERTRNTVDCCVSWSGDAGGQFLEQTGFSWSRISADYLSELRFWDCVFLFTHAKRNSPTFYHPVPGYPTLLHVVSMPRATWKKLPVDPEKHPSYVEKILATSASNAVVDKLSNHARRRDLLFRSDNYRTDVDLTSHISKLAAAVQTPGEVSEGRCSRCAGEGCPFTECVHIPSEQYGRCGNCIYLRVPCSCGDGMQDQSPPLEMLITDRPDLANQSPFGAYLVQSNRPKADANFAPEPPGKSGVLDDAHVDAGEAPETPNNPDSSDRYVVLGDLVPPRPPAELKERPELFEKDLQALDAREMLRESTKREPSHQPTNTLLALRGCPIINLNGTFREFQS